MHVNRPRVDPAAVADRRRKAKARLQFVADIYRAQLERGARFLLEHPVAAGFWGEDCVQRLMEHPEVQSGFGHMR
eukprot:7163632-Alexandrium_andersonii.AAC.1